MHKQLGSRCSVLAAVATALLASCMALARARNDSLSPGARYVAMGSSFGAGPGLTPRSGNTSSGRCGQSVENYAHQLARKRSLTLVDVTCSGATTAHLLGPWGELPAQLDALTTDTRLVTITIGGNDVGYIGGLTAASCRRAGLPPGAPSSTCPDVPAATEHEWQALEQRMVRVIAEVRRRAPVARIVLVDYLSVLPETDTCADVPLAPEEADQSRAVAKRLASLTAAAARKSGAELLQASAMSRGHDACSSAAWVTGYARRGGPRFKAPYHPNLAGMSAIADALDRLLSR